MTPDPLRPLSPEEAQRAYDEAPAVPLSDERIEEIVRYATGKDAPAGHTAALLRELDETAALLEDLAHWLGGAGLPGSARRCADRAARVRRLLARIAAADVPDPTRPPYRGGAPWPA